MPILTSFDAEQKRNTQIIGISKTAALEQRSAIKLCVANKKSRQETLEMLKTTFGNKATKKTALYKWYSKFEQGDNSVTGETRPEGVDRGVPDHHFPPPLSPLPSPSAPTSLPLCPHFPPPIKIVPPP